MTVDHHLVKMLGDMIHRAATTNNPQVLYTRGQVQALVSGAPAKVMVYVGADTTTPVQAWCPTHSQDVIVGDVVELRIYQNTITIIGHY